MKRLLTLVAFFATIQASAQQVNPVPDYVFRNQMSVGRGTVTDTAAYFSIGPRYGAVKGFMPPIVVDTASFSGSKRNGLLIFSVQKNKFLYWDSVRVQWSDMAGSSGSYIVAGDTAAMLAPYLRKSDTTAMLTPYIRHAGYGLTKSGQSFLVDTLNIATRAWRQKGLDSLAALEVSGSGTTNYVPKFTAGTTIGNSQIFDNATNVGIGTASPGVKLDIVGSAGTIVRTKGGTGSSQGSAYYVQLAGSTSTLSAFGDRANIFGGTVDQIASIYTGSGIPLTFDVNAAERLRIFANGRVGINTTTDAGYQLDVNGTLRSVNGANFATTSGQVGIGKTSPSAKSKLDVEGNIDIADGSFYYYRNTVANTGTYGIYYSNTAPKYPIRLAVNADPTNNRFFEIGWHKNDNKDSTWNPTFSVNSYNAETFINTTTDAGDYKLQVSGNIYNTGSAVLAATSGNVGVGVVPSAWSVVTAMQIKQGALSADQASNIFNLTNNVFYDGSANKYIQNGSAAFYQQFANQHIFYNSPSGTAGGTITLTERMRIDASGNVGIGTASPASILNVRASSATLTIDDSGDGTSKISFRPSAASYAERAFLSVDYGTAEMRIAAGASGGAYFQSFYTNGTERARFNSAGEFIIDASGTDAGDYKLQVSGNIYNTGSAVLAATSGEAYIGTTSDAGNYKLQVSGQAFIRNTGTSGALYLDSTSLSIYEVKNRHAILISGHSLTGAEIQGPIYVGTNWNTSGDVSAIEVALTNTASGANSNFMKLSDGTNTFRVTKDAGIFTAAPSGGTARKWKLGSVVATTVILDTANYVEVEINGVAYKLALVTPN